MERLRNKVAIVTGAASRIGIGFATARRLAQEGAKVVLSDLDEPALKERERELRAENFAVIAMRQDVTREDEWERVVAEVVERFGSLDILVNNAGVCIL